MIQLQHIHSLTDFQRNVKTHLKRMKKTGQAQVLTVNGKAEFVVQDAASYQKLLDAADESKTVEAIRRGLKAFAQGDDMDAFEALDKLRKKHGLPRPHSQGRTRRSR